MVVRNVLPVVSNLLRSARLESQQEMLRPSRGPLKHWQLPYPAPACDIALESKHKSTAEASASRAPLAWAS